MVYFGDGDAKVVCFLRNIALVMILWVMLIILKIITVLLCYKIITNEQSINLSIRISIVNSFSWDYTLW